MKKPLPHQLTPAERGALFDLIGSNHEYVWNDTGWLRGELVLAWLLQSSVGNARWVADNGPKLPAVLTLREGAIIHCAIELYADRTGDPDETEGRGLVTNILPRITGKSHQEMTLEIVLCAVELALLTRAEIARHL